MKKVHGYGFVCLNVTGLHHNVADPLLPIIKPAFWDLWFLAEVKDCEIALKISLINRFED